MTELASRACYVDANVLIYALEGTEEVSAPIAAFLNRARTRPGCLRTSELTLAEVLAMPRGGSAFTLAEKRRLYGDLLLQEAFMTLHPVGRDILIGTAELRQATGQKLADAIHVVTALETGCGYFLTSDAGLGRKTLPPSLTHVRPTGPELDLLADHLHV